VETGSRTSKENGVVLHIQDFIIETIALVRPLLETIEHRNGDLGRQMARAASSIALNVAEGAYSQGRNETARFHTALGSANETLCCLRVAAALGYITPCEPELVDRFQRIIATLKNLTRRRR
jgi:four helix bundle protein